MATVQEVMQSMAASDYDGKEEVNAAFETLLQGNTQLQGRAQELEQALDDARMSCRGYRREMQVLRQANQALAQQRDTLAQRLNEKTADENTPTEDEEPSEDQQSAIPEEPA